jgi:hypothetical protein
VSPDIQGKNFIHEIGKAYGYSPADRVIASARQKRLRGKRLDLDELSRFQNIIKATGICCFSSEKNDILMWSHYALDHSGLCIGFHSNRHFFRTAWEVEYSDHIPIITRPHDDAHTMLEKALLTKSKHWSYEKEWRIIRRTMTDQEVVQFNNQHREYSREDLETFTNQRGPGFYKFPKEAIAEVTVGIKATTETVTRIKLWIADANLEIPLYQAKRHPSEFTIIFEQL